jgi:O-antigen/teichoic acid export membrane protein
MIRKFFKDSVIYSISGFLTKGISLILFPIYTRVFTPHDYGLIDYVAVLGSVVAVSVALEVTQGLAIYYAEASNESEKKEYSSTAIWFTLFCYTLFLIVVFVFRRQFAALLFDDESFVNIVLLAAITFWSSGLVYAVQNQLRWELKSVLSAKFSLFITIASIGSTIFFVLLLRQGVSGALWAQILANVSGLILGLYFTRSSYGFVFIKKKLQDMLRFSLPLVPSSLGVMAALYIDRISVKQMLTLTDLGIFGVGYRIASIVSLLMVGFQSALTPIIFANHKDENTPHSLALIFRFFVALALICFATLSLFAIDVLRLLTPPEYHRAAIVTPPIVLGVLLWQMYIFAPGLSLAKRTSIIGLMNVGSAVLNLVLNFLLIPYMDICGAALATAISAGSVFCINMYLSQKLYYVPHQWSKIIIAFISTLLIVFFSFNIDFGLLWNITFKLGIFVSLLLFFIYIKLIERKHVMLFINEVKKLIKNIDR